MPMLSVATPTSLCAHPRTEQDCLVGHLCSSNLSSSSKHLSPRLPQARSKDYRGGAGKGREGGSMSARVSGETGAEGTLKGGGGICIIRVQGNCLCPPSAAQNGPMTTWPGSVPCSTDPRRQCRLTSDPFPVEWEGCLKGKSSHEVSQCRGRERPALSFQSCCQSGRLGKVLSSKPPCKDGP